MGTQTWSSSSGSASATFENSEAIAISYQTTGTKTDTKFVLDINADKLPDVTLTVHDGIATLQRGNQVPVILPAGIAEEAVSAAKTLCVNNASELPAGVDRLESLRNIANFLKTPNGNHIELSGPRR